MEAVCNVAHEDAGMQKNKFDAVSLYAIIIARQRRL